jgi:glycosyltransferase involved in cell wall biosynthesis
MTDISVVIPTCDRPDKLIEAVKCVLGQSHPPNEIIVVNNGTQPLDDRQIPKQVKIIELPPYVGVSQARNQGAAWVTSDFIAFLDDDDLWELDYLHKVAKVIEEHRPDCIITRQDKWIDGQVFPYKDAAGKLDLETLLVSNPGVCGSTTIISREVFNRVSCYDITLITGEDKALIIELLINGYSIMTAPHIQAILREHLGSRLGDPRSMVQGLSRFVNKYGQLMSPSQKNFNFVKIYYYSYLAIGQPIDYYRFWFRFLLHLYFRKVYSTLPAAPRLPILKPLKLMLLIFRNSKKKT